MALKSNVGEGKVKLSKEDSEAYNEWLSEQSFRDKLDKISSQYEYFKEMSSLSSNLYSIIKQFKNNKTQQKLNDLRKEINRAKNLDDKKQRTIDLANAERESFEKELNTFKKETYANQAIKGVSKFYNVALKAFDVLGINIKNMFRDVINNIAENLSRTGMASYDTTTSLFTNSEARSQAMKYGISSSTNWALTKTANMLFGGTGNLDENIAYMNPAQKEMFATLMSKYSSWYDQLQSTGVLQRIQEFQLDFAMLKEELAIDFMNWFAQNKEVVLGAITGTFSVIKAISSVIVGIANFLGGVKSSDSVLNGSKAITVNISNTNNNSLSNSSQLAIAQNISDTTIKSVARAIEAW